MPNCAVLPEPNLPVPRLMGGGTATWLSLWESCHRRRLRGRYTPFPLSVFAALSHLSHWERQGVQFHSVGRVFIQQFDKPIFPIRKIGNIFSKPIDKIGKWVYYLAIESEQRNERSGLQCLKSILMLHSLVVECVSPGHIRMAGCIRIRFSAPET